MSDTMPDDALPQWTHHEDGSVSIRLSRNMILNLADELNEWDEIYRDWFRMLDEYPKWKRSPILRENRRESVVYGNCLHSIETFLGRREIVKLRKQAKAEEEQNKQQYLVHLTASPDASPALPTLREMTGWVEEVREKGEL